MNFKDFFLFEQASNYFSNNEQIFWSINSNVTDLLPLHLISEASDDEGGEKVQAKYPAFNVIGKGTTNPKTAKRPESDETYLGSVLHLEPYMGSGSQMCPFATAIYRITAENLDNELLRQIQASPGYQQVEQYHVFYGFEVRFQKQEPTFGQSAEGQPQFGTLSDTLTSSQNCPTVMKIKLPNTSLRDWSGPIIKLNRSQIAHAELVGGCANSCLHFAGNPQLIPTKLEGRRKKTLQFQNSPKEFLSKILMDLFKLTSSAEEQGHRAVVRLNATSDIAWESDYYRFPTNPTETESLLRSAWPSSTSKKYANIIRRISNSNSSKFTDVITDVANYIAGKNILEIFPDMIFYDYTKNPARMGLFVKSQSKRNDLWPSNYHLTFSLAEGNKRECLKFLSQGGNVAAVFNVLQQGKYKGDLPATWYGYRVIDGDKHDYRFLDERGVVVGLRAKGEAKYKDIDFGFVIQPDDEGLDPTDPAVAQMKSYIDAFQSRLSRGKIMKPGEKKEKYRTASEKIGYQM